MIRRDFVTVDGAQHWLLISQVEHARISGQLARHWTAADLSPYECGGEQPARAVSDEILAAITHHDDGWARWEESLRIDPAHGRPYSFMNELPLEESLAIWQESVMAARSVGRLAGWMVASHFTELLQSGNHASDQRAIAWLADVQRRRRAWHDQWRRASSHTSRLAERALGLLQAGDFLSLWLCCDCPVAANEQVADVAPFAWHWPERGVGPYQFSARRGSPSSSKHDDIFAESGWLVTGTAWPFDRDELEIAGDAWLAPARRYSSSQELLNARRPARLRWRLVRET